MSEAVVYLDEKSHTGQFRDAASQLILTDLRVVHECTDRLGLVNPSTSPVMLPVLLRSAISPEAISPRTKRLWSNAERIVNGLLFHAHLVRNPQKAARGMVEFVDSTKSLKSQEDALGFLNLTGARLEYLLSDDGQQRLDALRLGTVSFVENSLLRRAIHQGIYSKRAENY